MFAVVHPGFRAIPDSECNTLKYAAIRRQMRVNRCEREITMLQQRSGAHQSELTLKLTILGVFVGKGFGCSAVCAGTVGMTAREVQCQDLIQVIIVA